MTSGPAHAAQSSLPVSMRMPLRRMLSAKVQDSRMMMSMVLILFNPSCIARLSVARPIYFMPVVLISFNHFFDEFTERVKIIHKVQKIRLQFVLQKDQLIPVELIIASVYYKMPEGPKFVKQPLAVV